MPTAATVCEIASETAEPPIMIRVSPSAAIPTRLAEVTMALALATVTKRSVERPTTTTARTATTHDDVDGELRRGVRRPAPARGSAASSGAADGVHGRPSAPWVISRSRTALAVSPVVPLHDDALVHGDDDVGEVLQLLELGAAEEHRHAPVRGVAQQGVDGRPAADVDPAGGLVEQQDPDVVAAEAATDEDLLLVAAAQRADVVAGPLCGRGRTARASPVRAAAQRRRLTTPSRVTSGSRVASRFQLIGLSRNRPSDLRSLETNAMPARTAAAGLPTRTGCAVDLRAAGWRRGPARRSRAARRRRRSPAAPPRRTPGRRAAPC